MTEREREDFVKLIDLYRKRKFEERQELIKAYHEAAEAFERWKEKVEQGD